MTAMFGIISDSIVKNQSKTESYCLGVINLMNVLFEVLKEIN
jgi:hypothetical protein